MHTTDWLQKKYCNFVQMWTEKYYIGPQITIAILQWHTKKIDTLAILQESKGNLGGDEAAGGGRTACGKDCGIISCYQLILSVYRHFTHSIYYSHALNSIWGLDMGDRHAHKHTKATNILLCLHITTEDTVRYFFLWNNINNNAVFSRISRIALFKK